jgi:hypothetical protein
MNDNINMESTIAESMNDNVNMDSTIAGSMNDNINMDSTIAGYIIIHELCYCTVHVYNVIH